METRAPQQPRTSRGSQQDFWTRATRATQATAALPKAHPRGSAARSPRRSDVNKLSPPGVVPGL